MALPFPKRKVRWGARHSPSADVCFGRQPIWKQMMERQLQLRMQKKPMPNYNPPVQRSFTLQPLLATAWQDDVNSTAYHQAGNHAAQKPSNLQCSKQKKSELRGPTPTSGSLNFTQLREKIVPGPLNSTLECILPLDFQIRRI